MQFAWPLVVIFYLIGSLALVYHFANGLWTFAITWGLTVTENAQRRWGWVCLGLGLLLTAASLASIYGFATYELPEGFHPDQSVKGVEGQ